MRPISPERLVTLYAVLVVISVAFALAGVSWRIAGFADTPASSVSASPPASARPAVPAADVAAIAALAPFGRPDPDAAPLTRLPIVLRGVIRATPDAASSAWIAPANGTVRSFRVGATVAPGAVLKSVGKDHVLLDVGGQTERLTFPRKEPASRPVAPPAPAAEEEGA